VNSFQVEVFDQYKSSAFKGVPHLLENDQFTASRSSLIFTQKCLIQKTKFNVVSLWSNYIFISFLYQKYETHSLQTRLGFFGILCTVQKLEHKAEEICHNN